MISFRTVALKYLLCAIGLQVNVQSSHLLRNTDLHAVDHFASPPRHTSDTGNLTWPKKMADLHIKPPLPDIFYFLVHSNSILPSSLSQISGSIFEFFLSSHIQPVSKSYSPYFQNIYRTWELFSTSAPAINLVQVSITSCQDFWGLLGILSWILMACGLFLPYTKQTDPFFF